MKRYQGEGVQNGDPIAVVSNDAIGNYVVATPLLQMLRGKFPNSPLSYFCGTRTQELASATTQLFDEYFPLHGTEPRSAVQQFVQPQERAFNLVVNMEFTPWAMAVSAMLAGSEGYVCGPCLGPEGRAALPFATDALGDLWRDQEWISEDLCIRYPFLKTAHISEIFCRLAYLEGEVPPYLVPQSPSPLPVPDVLIASSASLDSKLWPLEKWVETLLALESRGFTVGLLGAAPKVQGAHWKGNDLEHSILEQTNCRDLRGKLTMPEVVGALATCRAVLTLDNGILHLACAAGAKTVGLFRWGIHRLWAPKVDHLVIVTPDPEEDVASIDAKVVTQLVLKELE